jgi:Domain of unknown function (DUF6484)
MKPTTAPEPPAAAEPTEDPQGEEASGEDLVELILAERAARMEAAEALSPKRIDGVVIGVLRGFAESGEPLVQHPEIPDGARLSARSVVALADADVGREVALLFEGGDPEKPMVMGLLHAPRARVVTASPDESSADQGQGEASARPVEVSRDGERIEFNAEKEIVLRCGKASITLTRAGKILIRGAYLLTRSSGVNRIQGGSVQIN